METIYSKVAILEKRNSLLEKEILKEYEDDIRRANENFLDGYSHYSFDVKGHKKGCVLADIYTKLGYTAYLEDTLDWEIFTLNITL